MRRFRALRNKLRRWPPANLSPGAAEVVRLAGSGVGDDVVLAYIQNSQAPFNLTADDVLYLKDIGLSPQVISAMLSHDSTLRGQPQQYAPAAAGARRPQLRPARTLTYDWQPATRPGGSGARRRHRRSTAPPPAYVTSAPADVSYFYNDLSPYGTWVSLEGYGWCWQPRTVVISRGWRPYCDGGYWVYTDAGWYWQSDYSWGWAPFHYGRWYMHPRCGWVWMPDRVWGPAWVTWRTGGDVCGWAPLPPHAEFDVRLGWRFNGVRVGANFDFGLGANSFAFVSFGDFCSHNLGHHCLPPAQVTAIYRQTAIINNYVVRNNTMVHGGIPIERVSAASRVAVPRATVRDWTAGSARMPNRAGRWSIGRRSGLRPDRSIWWPSKWMRGIRSFSLLPLRRRERHTPPATAAAVHLRVLSCTNRPCKRLRPLPGRAAHSPGHPGNTRQPQGLPNPP